MEEVLPLDVWEHEIFLRRKLIARLISTVEELRTSCAFHINPLPDTLAVNDYNGYRF